MAAVQEGLEQTDQHHPLQIILLAAKGCFLILQEHPHNERAVAEGVHTLQVQTQPLEVLGEVAQEELEAR